MTNNNSLVFNPQIARIVLIMDRATAKGNPGRDFTSSILLQMGDFLSNVLILLGLLLGWGFGLSVL